MEFGRRVSQLTLDVLNFTDVLKAMAISSAKSELKTFPAYADAGKRCIPVYADAGKQDTFASFSRSRAPIVEAGARGIYPSGFT